MNYRYFYYPLLQRGSITRYINYLINCLSFKKKRSILRCMPYIAIIETTNLCNLRCPLCPTGKNMFKQKGFMNKSIYKKLIDDLYPYLFEVWLYNWGEPFLDRNIFNYVDYASKCNISTTISTNLNYLPNNYEKYIIDSRLERLVVSFDGFSQKAYSKYRVGGNIEVLKENLERIVREKKTRKSILPFIELQYLIHRDNIEDINKTKEYAKKIGVYIRFKRLQFDRSNKKHVKKWSLDCSVENKNVKPNKIKCEWPWKYIVINYDGTITPCCNWMDDKRFIFGNVLYENIKGIWNNDYYTSARLSIAGKVSKIKTACNTCLGNPPAID